MDFSAPTAIFNDPIAKKCTKAVISYMAYFGSKYVGNDIQVLCGNLLDHPYMKTFTLFCIMYQATDRFDLSIIMTSFFLVLQYVMSLQPICNKYIDKTSPDRGVKTSARIWARDKAVDKLGLMKTTTATTATPQTTSFTMPLNL